MNYACYSCGEIDGEYTEDDLGRKICQVCKEHTIVSEIETLDLLMYYFSKYGPLDYERLDDD